jgi:hypothetical protein
MIYLIAPLIPIGWLWPWLLIKNGIFPQDREYEGSTCRLVLPALVGQGGECLNYYIKN